MIAVPVAPGTERLCLSNSPHNTDDAHGKGIWVWYHKPFGDSEPVSVDGFTYNLRFPGQHQSS